MSLESGNLPLRYSELVPPGIGIHDPAKRRGMLVA